MTNSNNDSSTRANENNVQQTRRASVYLFWVLQGLLAALFLMAGVVKVISPAQKLQGDGSTLAVPVLLLRFVGAAEILGALGLLLPGIFRIAKYLTPLAAIGLAIITAGATVTVLPAGVAGAVFPFVICMLCILVAYYHRGELSSSATDTRAVANKAMSIEL